MCLAEFPDMIYGFFGAGELHAWRVQRPVCLPRLKLDDYLEALHRLSPAVAGLFFARCPDVLVTDGCNQPTGLRDRWEAVFQRTRTISASDTHITSFDSRCASALAARADDVIE
jgi:hypothetical protein